MSEDHSPHASLLNTRAENDLIFNISSYGDRYPKSVGGRLFAVLWILMGMCIISILTATLTSSMTTFSLEAKVKLPGTKVRKG